MLCLLQLGKPHLPAPLLQSEGEWTLTLPAYHPTTVHEDSRLNRLLESNMFVQEVYGSQYTTELMRNVLIHACMQKSNGHASALHNYVMVEGQYGDDTERSEGSLSVPKSTLHHRVTSKVLISAHPM